MDVFSNLLNADVKDKWTEFPESLNFTHDILKKSQTETLWATYFIIHNIDKKLIGTCGFKGGPDDEGTVEIGYEIAEPYRLRGLATETAQGLLDFALKDSRVKFIRAHTLATLNPSVSVLEKLNFYLVGLFNDPDDGDIWRWELEV